MSEKLIIQPNPHIRSNNSTAKIMLNVIIASLPAMIASVLIFGTRAALLIVTCVCACVFFEYLFRVVVFKRTQSIHDLSAVVTGILLAFNLPVTLPWYMAVIGSFVAIVVVKEMFGGLGQNFANPAVVGRIVLVLSFSAYMSDYVNPVFNPFREGYSAVTSATPLVTSAEEMPSMLELFLGFHGGALGETSSAALLLGFIYLLIMRIIRPVTPVIFTGTVAIGTFIITGSLNAAITAILTGGLLLGAVFMATDYVTNPMTLKGKMVFAFGCGLITLVIRQFGAMPEGVAFSILTMNLLTPAIDKLTHPKAFGVKEPPKPTKVKEES